VGLAKMDVRKHGKRTYLTKCDVFDEGGWLHGWPIRKGDGSILPLCEGRFKRHDRF
jgi:hypothetical protein